MGEIGPAGSVEQARRSLFILRRACWYGRVTSGDIQEAFGITRQIASKDLNQAVNRWVWYDEKGHVHPILSRGNRAVSAVYPVHRHEVASSRTMMQLLSAQAGFTESGLRQSEVNVLFPSAREDRLDSHVLDILLQATINRKSVGLGARAVIIRYVGLKKGDTFRDRRILPVAIEFDGAQTRVHAQDLEVEDWPIKAFVLARIESAELHHEALPKHFIRRDVSRRDKIRLRLTLDPRLTDNQKRAVAREIGMSKNGVAEVDTHYAHAFRRFYTNGVPQDSPSDIIWPPVIFAESVP